MPSNLIFPDSFDLSQPLFSTKSLYDTVSALINPFSKSVCISPAAFRAVLFYVIVHALDSSGPEVKKGSRESKW